MNKRTSTKDILIWLLKAGGVVILSVLAPQLPYRLLNGYLKNRYRLRERLKILEEKGWLKISESADQIKLELVEKGKKKVLFYKLNSMQITKSKIWDGLWRMVIFDIPEEKRLARDALRRKLKQLGFYQLQKSAFIHPYDCQKEIKIIKLAYGIQPFVTYMEVKNIDKDKRKYLLEKFGIKS